MMECKRNTAEERKFCSWKQERYDVSAYLDRDIRERMLGKGLRLRYSANGTGFERQLANIMAVAHNSLLDT